MKLANGMLIANGKATAVQFEDNIHEIYKLVECDTIDMVQRTISGRHYVFIVDDEGKIKDKPKAPSAYATDYAEVIVGNILIVKGEDAEGLLKSVSLEDSLVIANAMSEGILFYQVRR